MRIAQIFSENTKRNRRLTHFPPRCIDRSRLDPYDSTIQNQAARRAVTLKEELS